MVKEHEPPSVWTAGGVFVSPNHVGIFTYGIAYCCACYCWCWPIRFFFRKSFCCNNTKIFKRLIWITGAGEPHPFNRRSSAKHPPVSAKIRLGVLLMNSWMLNLKCRTWGSHWGSTRRLNKLVSTLYPVGLVQRGTLSLGDWLRCFQCQHVESWLVFLRHDTPLAFLFSLAGCSSF